LRSDEPRADSLEISRFLPSFLGKMAVFDKTDSLYIYKYICIYIYIYINYFFKYV